MAGAVPLMPSPSSQAPTRRRLKPAADEPSPRVENETGAEPTAVAPVRLETLLEQLGPSVLDIIAAPRGLQVPVRAPVIYDPSMLLAGNPGDVLLAVGIAASSARAVTLLQQGASAGAVAAVFKGGENLDLLASTADRVGIALLVIPPELGWDGLHGMVTAVIAASTMSLSDRTQAQHGPPLDDLFALADAVAANLSGTVTIHNHHMQIVAFSTLDDPIDDLAARSILRRTPPDSFLAWLERAGIYGELLRSNGIVRIERDGIMPRLAVAIRGNRGVLGWIMVANPGRVEEGEADSILAEASRVASIELVRLSGVEDVARKLRSELFRSVLDSHGSPAVLGAHLEIDLQAAGSFFAMEVHRSDVTQPVEAIPSSRLHDFVALRLEATERRSVTTVLGTRIYGLLPRPGQPSANSTRDLAEQIVGHARRSLGLEVSVAFGELRSGLEEIASARAEADRVLRRLSAGHEERVAAWDQFSAESVLEELKELALSRPRLRLGPVATLAEIDRLRGTSHIETLRTFLDAGCDLTAAANALYIHRNTLRYRIQRIEEISGFDRTNPTERLVTELQLRLLDPPRE